MQAKIFIAAHQRTYELYSNRYMAIDTLVYFLTPLKSTSAISADIGFQIRDKINLQNYIK